MDLYVPQSSTKGGLNMAFHRYLIEIGQGVDMHGGNNTKAALKALQDATHHCCMAGVHEIFQFSPGDGNIWVKADIYAPETSSIDTRPLHDYLGAYDTEILLHTGGASAPGLYIPQMGVGDHITVVLAVLTVYVNSSN